MQEESYFSIQFSVDFFFFLPQQKQHRGGDCSFFPISEVRCLLHKGRRAYGPLCLFLSQDSFRLGKLHCLLRSNTSAKLEFLKMKDLIYHSTEKRI